MTKEDKQIIKRAVKEEWRIGDRSRLKRLLEKNLKLYRENVELENQNKLLGERCNQLLKDKGNLTDELAQWKDEWQTQVQKAIDEGYVRTLQTIQLTKARKLLKQWVELYKPKLEGYPITPIQEQTEQFIKEIEK